MTQAPHPLPPEPDYRILLVDDMPAIHEDYRKILAPPQASAAQGQAADALDALELALFAEDDGPQADATSGTADAPSAASASAGGSPAGSAPTAGRRAASYQIDSAYQGQEALQRLQQARREGRSYALAFVDMRMPPGWDGVETIEHLWREDPQLQVVLCTAYSDYAWEDVLDHLQAHDRLLILKKPFDAIEVVQLAHTLCAKWHGAREVERHTHELEDQVRSRTLELEQSNEWLRNELQERQRREGELALAATIVANAANGVVVTDETSCALSVNPAFSAITGWTAEEVLGRKLSLLRSDRHATGYHRAQWEQMLREGRWTGELWSRRKDGSLFCEWRSITRVPGAPGQAARCVCIVADITEQRRLDEHIRHMAYHDPLTGLANRSRLGQHLGAALAEARRLGRHVGLLFIDLDRFKPVNDTLGHDVGDALLKVVAERLQGEIREGDMAARVGGDEFVLLLNGINDPQDIARAAERILQNLQTPMAVGPHRLQVGASIGSACGPRDGDTVDALLRHADQAMYAIKSTTRRTAWAPEI